MKASFYKPLLGAALLLTMAACQNRPSHGDYSHGEHMSSKGGSHDAMVAMGDPIFNGAFRKGEYEASGTVAIHKEGEQTTLHLSEDFATNPKAPDLYVAIGNSANPIADKRFPYPLSEGEYELLEMLESATGEQVYEVPADVDLSADHSVIIWCKQFNATMSYAPLEAVPMN